MAICLQISPTTEFPFDYHRYLIQSTTYTDWISLFFTKRNILKGNTSCHTFAIILLPCYTGNFLHTYSVSIEHVFRELFTNNTSFCKPLDGSCHYITSTRGQIVLLDYLFLRWSKGWVVRLSEQEKIEILALKIHDCSPCCWMVLLFLTVKAPDSCHLGIAFWLSSTWRVKDGAFFKQEQKNNEVQDYCFPPEQ